MMYGDRFSKNSTWGFFFIAQKEHMLAVWKYLSAFGMKDHKHVYR